MAFEVGDTEEDICHEDVMGDGDRFEEGLSIRTLMALFPRRPSAMRIGASTTE